MLIGIIVKYTLCRYQNPKLLAEKAKKRKGSGTNEG